MKSKLLSSFLLALVGLVGNVTATAQTPEPDGLWTFENTADLLAASKGSLLMTPCAIGDHSISASTVDEAGIKAADGPTAGSAAILVPATSALKVDRGEGAPATTSFSLMIDLKVPDAYAYDGLLQSNLANSNDGDLFISKCQIGAGAMGGYFGCMWSDMWYRVVFTNSEGSLKVYVNGEKVLQYATTETRWELAPTFYLLADEDGEKVDTYVSEIAFWETPLTDAEVSEMGSIDLLPWITDVAQIKEGDQFFIISDRARFAGNTSGKPKAMSAFQADYTIDWGEQYVYWGTLNEESDGFVWTAEKVGDQWAFFNKEKQMYLGNMNEGEADIIFSETPVGYTLTDLEAGAGRFFLTSDDSEHSPHVQGYLMVNRPNNSLAKQEVGDDGYERATSAQCGYPGRWRLLKLNADEPVETGMKIETLDDFLAFAEAVNSGQTDLEAYLAADIELTDNTMVGAYAGTFDGKGHKITYNYTTVGNHSGLFKTLNDGAIIRNLYVEGSAIVQGIHFGALAGDYYGNVLVENVVTNVNITGDRGGVTGDGGMAGYVDGQVTFNNCATLGKMGNPGTSMYCGFVAFATGTSVSILNNCYTACELTEGTGTSYCYTFCRGTYQPNNCYYLNAIGEVQGIAFDAATLATGEFCYMLNGDQSSVNWYQTLGEDATPVPFDSHLQVYANGELKCDGTSAGGELVYSNSASSVIPPHTFDGGFGWCSVCGTWDANYKLPVDGEGYSLIANAKEFAWFAEYMEKGNPSLNIRLTADIDLRTDFPDVMIAKESNRFSGTFDGQEHTITYNYANVTDKWRGLFRSVENATIRNLRVEGSATSTNIHFGALIGVAYGTVLVENVVTNVNITGKSTSQGVVQGDAGMLGANYANITFNHCATLGEMGNEGTSMYSSFSGWSNGNSMTTLNNCYTTCKLTAGTGTGNCFTLTHEGGPVEINNSYYLYEVGKVQGNLITEDFASGEFCYKLNGDQSEINWYQTIGTDAKPVPFASHGQVYANGTVRCDGAEIPDSPVTYSNVEGQMNKPDHQYGADGYCTVCGSVMQNKDGFYLIDNAEKLNWFAQKIASGATAIDGLLTADIDLTTSDYPDLMIASETNKYAGTFDGAGHTITYSYTVSSTYCGLFRYVSGATIRNLIVEGNAIVTDIHYGALIGRVEGNVLVENVITNVNITGQKNGVTGDGGMLGALYGNITFNNCATLGKMGYEGSSMYSGFSGFSHGASSATLNNCYTISELTEGTGTGNCFTFIHNNRGTYNNCYYLNAIGTVQGTAITAEEVANGSLCAKLGQGWYQNIGEDAYPVFDKTHAVVKEITEAGYATMYIPNSVDIPAGVEVFTGEFEESWLKLNAVEGTVPAWEPVVLKGAPGFYGFMPATAEEKSTEIVFADLGFESAADLTTLQQGGLTIGFAQGSNTADLVPKYYPTSGAAARIYAGNTMTISAVAPITKIEFTFVNNYALQSGSYQISEGSYALATTTWTGSAESITFSNTGSKQWRIISMTITYSGYPDNIAGNVLKGAAEDIDAVGKYVLAQPEGEPTGFYLADSGVIKAGKAYLENASGVKAFIFGEDNSTGIADLNEVKGSDNAVYNLAGQRLQKMQKGINIVNGKKILVK